MSEQWKVEIGAFSPDWFTEAMLSGRVVPVSDKWPGRWADDGVRIVRSGRIVLPSETVTRDEVSFQRGDRVRYVGREPFNDSGINPGWETTVSYDEGDGLICFRWGSASRMGRAEWFELVEAAPLPPPPVPDQRIIDAIAGAIEASVIDGEWSAEDAAVAALVALRDATEDQRTKDEVTRILGGGDDRC
jgi:hypothetical protein